MDDLLTNLDTAQREVATQLIGPTRVLAGAGTGKTRALTYRIAYGIQSGMYDPSSILVLTFTQKAAAELRLRLQALGLPPVQAKTFHAAALGQLRYFWPQVVGERLPRILPSKGTVVAEAAHSLGLNVSPELIRQISGEIEWRKVRQMTVEQYANVRTASVQGIEAEQLTQVMMRYEHLKDAQRALDFDDVLLVMLGMMRLEQSVAAEVRERYRVFLVDEFQDISQTQWDLLRAWMGRRRDLCVVGDVSQTIYRFAGAEPKYLLEFASEFPGAQSFTLSRNYRSSAPIVALANEIMHGQPGAVHLDAVVRPRRPGSDDTVEIVQCADDEHEAAVIASSIRGLLARGVKAQDIAVLTRINAQLPRIESALRAAAVPIILKSVKPFFARDEVKTAVLQLEVAKHDRRPLTVVVDETLRRSNWAPEPPAAEGPLREAWESLQLLRSLAQEAQAEGLTLARFVESLQLRRSQQYEPVADAVTLTTIHAAKGLEWSHVIVAGVSDGLVPYGDTSNPDELAEERRLLYVAVTRAVDGLLLTWAGRGFDRSRAMSRFIAALPETAVRRRVAPAPAAP